MITTFVADDEPLARRKLLALLAGFPWLTNVGEAASGVEALERIEALEPDLALLDVAMPEMSGLEVARRLRHPAVVVFTTAYDEHAVTAFELEAVDYVVKPFGERRLRTALERARRMIELRSGAAALDRARRAATAAEQRGALVERVLVRADRGAIVPVALEDVVRLEAQDDYVALHLVSGRSHLVGVRLSDLERRLPSPPFLRIHRSHVVNLRHVVRLVPFDGSRLHVEMKDGMHIVASRSRSQAIRDAAL